MDIQYFFIEIATECMCQLNFDCSVSENWLFQVKKQQAKIVQTIIPFYILMIITNYWFLQRKVKLLFLNDCGLK